MAIILLEGLDRTGKTTVAQLFKNQGYEHIHLSAPPKELSQPGYAGPSYLDMMVDLISQASIKDIVLDRTAYGELVWPQIYGRKPHLNDEDMEILRELEESAGVQRILMYDPNVEAHWQRCVDNKEPLTKAQFIRARSLYDKLADKYKFEKKTLKDFVDVKDTSKSGATQSDTRQSSQSAPTPEQTEGNRTDIRQVESSDNDGSSREQEKLEKANAINDVLSKRILKSKGLAYDALEAEIRTFLKDRLGKIFGESVPEFSKEEIKVLKLFCERLKNKESK